MTEQEVTDILYPVFKKKLAPMRNGKRGKDPLPFLRDVAIYFLRSHTPWTDGIIAIYFDKDRSSVVQAVGRCVELEGHKAKLRDHLIHLLFKQSGEPWKLSQSDEEELMGLVNMSAKSQDLSMLKLWMGTKFKIT